MSNLSLFQSSVTVLLQYDWFTANAAGTVVMKQYLTNLTKR